MSGWSYAAAFDEARAHLATHGIAFMVLTEVEIRRARAHEVAAALLRYRKAGIDDHLRSVLLERLRGSPKGMDIDELAKECGAHRVDILHLAAIRDVLVSKTLTRELVGKVFPRNEMEVDHGVQLESWFDAALW